MPFILPYGPDGRQRQYADSRLQYDFDREFPDAEHPIAELEVRLRGAGKPARIDAVDGTEVRLGPQEKDDALDRQLVALFQQGTVAMSAPRDRCVRPRLEVEVL